MPVLESFVFDREAPQRVLFEEPFHFSVFPKQPTRVAMFSRGRVQQPQAFVLLHRAVFVLNPRVWGIFLNHFQKWVHVAAIGVS